jgi:hypothetical protein
MASIEVSEKLAQVTIESTEVSEKLALINENLAEVLNPELIESVLAEGRNPRVYWGTVASIISS